MVIVSSWLSSQFSRLCIDFISILISKLKNTLKWCIYFNNIHVSVESIILHTSTYIVLSSGSLTCYVTVCCISIVTWLQYDTLSEFTCVLYPGYDQVFELLVSATDMPTTTQTESSLREICAPRCSVPLLLYCTNVCWILVHFHFLSAAFCSVFFSLLSRASLLSVLLMVLHCHMSPWILLPFHVTKEDTHSMRVWEGAGKEKMTIWSVCSSLSLWQPWD